MIFPIADGATVDPEALLKLRFLATEIRRRRPNRTSARPGPFVTRRRGRGSETDDIRLWSHGDDIRAIDRNVTARTGEPHVRTFRDERERATLLLADFRAPMLFGTRRAFLSVAAAEILALVGWSVAAEGGRVGLLAIGPDEPVWVKPFVGERAMIAVVGGLASAHRQALARVAAPAAPLGPSIAAAARSVAAGSTIVIASSFDAAGDDLPGALSEAMIRTEVAAVVLSDAFERSAPAGVYPFATAGGARGIGAVLPARMAPRPAPGPSGIVERLAAGGVRAVPARAEDPPAAQAAVLEALHG